MFIPYRLLSENPVRITLADALHVKLCLAQRGGATCLVSLASAHTFDQFGPTITVPVGTAFDLEYRGKLFEIWLGRRLVICDAPCTGSGRA